MYFRLSRFYLELADAQQMDPAKPVAGSNESNQDSSLPFGWGQRVSHTVDISTLQESKRKQPESAPAQSATPASDNSQLMTLLMIAGEDLRTADAEVVRIRKEMSVVRGQKGDGFENDASYKALLEELEDAKSHYDSAKRKNDMVMQMMMNKMS